MVIMEAYCVEAKRLFKQSPAGECFVENMGKVKVPTEDRFAGEIELVSPRTAQLPTM